MWLLDTHQAELRWFSSAADVPGGYAILSHVWLDHEQTFHEIQALRELSKETHENPRDLADPKIRQACIVAEREGYRWIWIDSCCIDKTSSSELTEAINSMYKWYSLAQVCFAYLPDVPSVRDQHKPDSPFRTSRWHTRGWTLQELIAPDMVLFLDQDWNIIGHKLELAPLLEEVTGIPRQVLTHEVCYSKIAVAERMSWAAKRRTTRLEDEAYCLMGIFDVNMPTIYGEGRRAFQRLQYEIITKQTVDTSLFAWGPCVLPSDSVIPMELQEIHQYFSPSSHTNMYLRAHSPKCFTKTSRRTVHYTPSAIHPLRPYPAAKRNVNFAEPEPVVREENAWWTFGPFGRMELPTLSLTPYGLECRFPIIESDGFVVAVLLCDTGCEHLGLLLHPSNNPVQDPSHKAYHTGHGFRVPSGPPVLARLVSLGSDFHNMRLYGKTVAAEWRDIVIVDSPPLVSKPSTPSLCSPLHSIPPVPPFRIPPWLVRRLSQVGMDLLPLELHSRPVDEKPLLVLVSFYDSTAGEGIQIILGTCTQSSDLPEHWAAATPRMPKDSYPNHVPIWSHDCAEHHVKAWENETKDFGDTERIVRLSFSHCKFAPEHTLVLNVELKGAAYSAIDQPKRSSLLLLENTTHRVVSLVDEGVPVAPVLSSPFIYYPSPLQSTIQHSQSDHMVPLSRNLAQHRLTAPELASSMDAPAFSFTSKSPAIVTNSIARGTSDESTIHKRLAHGRGAIQSQSLAHSYVVSAAKDGIYVLLGLTDMVMVLMDGNHAGSVVSARSRDGDAVASSDCADSVWPWDLHALQTLYVYLELQHAPTHSIVSPSKSCRIFFTLPYDRSLGDGKSHFCQAYDFDGRGTPIIVGTLRKAAKATVVSTGPHPSLPEALVVVETISLAFSPVWTLVLIAWSNGAMKIRDVDTSRGPLSFEGDFGFDSGCIS